MKRLLAFAFLVLISTGELAPIGEANECSKNIPVTTIICFGALCRGNCQYFHDRGHGKCHGLFKCRCTWPC
ncbi:hypothetical protein AMTRI_Chr09g35650 [Amborella trichopoda]